MNAHLRTVVVVSVIPLLVGVCTATAGDLNPPPGPLTPTMKTLLEVEPRIAINEQNTPGDSDAVFAITEPGSYYLTGALIGVEGKNGIRLSSGNVCIDLDGYEVVGPGSGDGIVSPYGDVKENVTIRNGIVRGWTNGIRLDHTSSVHLRDVAVSENALNGIYTGGPGIVEGCLARNNGRGISGYGTVTVRNCVATENQLQGIEVAFSCVVEGCIAFDNPGSGIVVSDNGNVVRGCFCRTNAVGLECVGTRTRIEENHVVDNAVGIRVAGSRNLVISNSAALNSTQDYDIGVGNAYGPIVNVAGVGDISGVAGANHPWANVSH
ncbi:MAG TPA: right-handed parallel beta-helix repeat-containing protein [Phycisphaerae bacterium]|nr:right-handed parallel beta-helix repeat-containing protein [Phycisphaerae bacterium]